MGKFQQKYQQKYQQKVQIGALWGAFAVYVMWNLILLWNHEPWRDEANVWLMARNLSPLQLLQEIKYQGHPCLWYFLVMPFAKMGFPYRTIGVLSTFVMTVTAWFYLRKSPQCIPVRILVLFSPVFTYFYPTIARNYCLVALLLILLAVSYPERNLHPIRYGILLGLLVQADTIAIAPAGMITLVWLWENAYAWWKEKDPRKLSGSVKGAVIALVSLLFWILQFYQVSDSPVFVVQDYEIRELFTEVRNYLYIILIRMTGWSQTGCIWFFVITFVLICVISVRNRNISGAAVFLLNCMFQCVFSVLVYQLHIWHYLSLCFTWIWMMWVMQDTAKEKQCSGSRSYRFAYGALTVTFGVLAVAMFLHWNSEEETSNLQNALHGSYSDGANAAAFIKENLDPEDLLLSTNVCMESSIAAFLPDYHFYYAGTGKEESYADWSEAQSGNISVEELLIFIREKFPDKEVAYLIQGGDSCINNAEELSAYEIVYETAESTARGEEYQIYRIEIQRAGIDQ